MVILYQLLGIILPVFTLCFIIRFPLISPRFCQLIYGYLTQLQNYQFKNIIKKFIKILIQEYNISLCPQLTFIKKESQKCTFHESRLKFLSFWIHIFLPEEDSRISEFFMILRKWSTHTTVQKLSIKIH